MNYGDGLGMYKKSTGEKGQSEEYCTGTDMANTGNKDGEADMIWREGKREVKWEKCSFEGWRKDQRSSGLESTKRKINFVSLRDLSSMILLH